MTKQIQIKDDFYNQQIKEEYLAQLPKTKSFKTIRDAFIRFGEELECPLQKDLYEMSQGELMAVLPNLEITNYTDIRIKMSFIIDYIDWAYKRNLTNDLMNVAREINIYDINLTKPMLVSHIKDDKTFAEMLETTYDIHRPNNTAVLWCMIWMGIPIKEAVLVKNEEIDLEKNTINYNNTLYKIPEVFHYIFDCYIKYDIMEYEGNNGMVIKKLIDSGYFIKPTRTMNKEEDTYYEPAPCNSNSLSTKLSNFKKDYRDITGKNVLYSTNTITSSGIFYRAYEEERAGKSIDGDYMADKFNILNFYKATKTQDKVEQYKLYKKVFWE